MTVIEFLYDFAMLFAARMREEFHKDLSIRYLEEDGRGGAELSFKGAAVQIWAEHPLTAVLNHKYTPVLTDEQWEMFCEEIGIEGLSGK